VPHFEIACNGLGLAALTILLLEAVCVAEVDGFGSGGKTVVKSVGANVFNGRTGFD